MASGASLRGQRFTKQKGKSDGRWAQRGETMGEIQGYAVPRTKRDKVNSEAHLAVLPSSLAARQRDVKTW